MTRRPVLRSYQARLSSSVTVPELHDEVAGEVLGLRLAALLAPEPDQGRLIAAHDDPGVRAADEGAAVEELVVPRAIFTTSSEVRFGL